MEGHHAHPGHHGSTLSGPGNGQDHPGGLLGALTPQQSFSVHLQSLDSIGGEIATQFDGLQKPESDVAGMLGAPLRAGDFVEATGLGQANTTSLGQMEEFLGQVKGALRFADEVTSAVATGYRSADADIATSYGAGTLAGTLAGTGAGVGTSDGLHGHYGYGSADHFAHHQHGQGSGAGALHHHGPEPDQSTGHNDTGHNDTGHPGGDGQHGHAGGHGPGDGRPEGGH